ncbi:hypothetical protein AAKU67_004361 [Oxalobacteraceae bacterium GrIS 2.11]
MNMTNIAVLNFSGNVGKTTVARHLLSERMHGAKIFSIETINSDGAEGDALRGREIIKVQIEMQMINNAIVDIGSSNVEDVMAVWNQNPGMHDDFDYFIVPVVPAMKQQRDTIATVETLSQLGIEANKIRVVFNQVDMTDNPETVFSGIWQYQRLEKKFTLFPSAVIHANPLYTRLAGSSMSIKQILSDTTDYKSLIQKTDIKEEKLRLLQLVALQRAAAGVTKELDAVFNCLLK